MNTTTSRTRIALIDDYGNLAKDLSLWSQLDTTRFEIDFYDHSPPTAILSKYEVIIAIRERTIFTRERLRELPLLRHLALTGRPSGQVDTAAAKEQGIHLSTTQGSRKTTAELTAAFILGHTKDLLRHDKAMRTGKWVTGFTNELAGKTIGIVGLGRLGSRVADFARTFELNVVSWASGHESAYAQEHGIARLPIKDLMAQSDIVTLHLRLNDNTRGLIGAEELSSMPDGALLINTARAPIVESAALMRELISGRIHAALDVYEEEPLPAHHPLRTLENVILTPHLGYVTNEVYHGFFTDVIQNIVAFEDQKQKD